MADLFAQRLRDARAKVDLTQLQLAELIGGNHIEISHYEAGRRKPPLRKLIALSDALHVSLDWLLGRQDGPDYWAAVRKKARAAEDLVMSSGDGRGVCHEIAYFAGITRRLIDEYVLGQQKGPNDEI